MTNRSAAIAALPRYILRYLDELLARTTGMVPSELSFLGWMPSTVTVPLLRADSGQPR